LPARHAVWHSGLAWKQSQRTGRMTHPPSPCAPCRGLLRAAKGSVGQPTPLVAVRSIAGPRRRRFSNSWWLNIVKSHQGTGWGIQKRKRCAMPRPRIRRTGWPLLPQGGLGRFFGGGSIFYSALKQMYTPRWTVSELCAPDRDAGSERRSRGHTHA
jgi:hypothetical protein